MSIYDISAAERRRRAQEMAHFKAQAKTQSLSRSATALHKEEDKSFWATIGDIGANVIKGAMKGLEGIYDFGATVVGGVGGLFSDEFQQDVREHVEHDWAGDTMTPWLEDLQKQSYLGEDSIVRNIASGVGGMLPAVVTGGVTHIGALGTGAMMLGAAGQSTEEAMKSGAGYGSSLAYGVGSGLVEGATEKLGGFAFGGTSKLGKAVAGTKFGNAVSKGIGKVAFDAVSEGAEEVLSDLADPALKYVTGVDKNIGENYADAAKGLGETFLTGAAVGSVMQGGQNFMRNVSNRDRGGSHATKADNAIANILEVTKNYTENGVNNYKYDNAVRSGLESISAELVKMSPEARKNYLDSIGAYKNAFDSETGKLKENLLTDTNRRAISANLRTISGTLTHKPLKSTEGITQGAEAVKKTVERVVGSGATVVVTNELSAEDRAIYNPDDQVIYINNNAELTGEDVANMVALHEITHTTEGTKAYRKLAKQIGEIVFDKDAPQAIKDIIGDFNVRQASTALDYAKDMANMNDRQVEHTLNTEVNADLIGDLLSDDYFIDRLAERDEGLIKRLYNRLTGITKKGTALDKSSVKYLKKLASKFGTAIDKRVGGVKLSQIQDDEEKEVETVSNSRYNRDRSKAKIARYIPYDKIGKANIGAIRQKLQSLYAGTDNTVADGIAIEHGNKIYVVDSGKENGKIDFGVRKAISISNPILRQERLEKINERAISDGFVSSELLRQFKRTSDNGSRSGIGRELGEELSADTGKSKDNQERVSGENGDRGRRVISDKRKSKNRSYDPKNGKEPTFEEAEAVRKDSFNALLQEHIAENERIDKQIKESLDSIIRAEGLRKLPVSDREYGEGKSASWALADIEREDSFEAELAEYNAKLIALHKQAKENAEGFIENATKLLVPVTTEFENTGSDTDRQRHADLEAKASLNSTIQKSIDEVKAIEKNRRESIEALIKGIKDTRAVTYEFENAQSNSDMADDVQNERTESIKQLALEAQERFNAFEQARLESFNSFLEKEAVYESITKMSPVRQISGEEFAKGEVDLVTQVEKYFEAYDFKVNNERLGEVLIDRRGIKDDIAHGIGRKKAATFAAVPDVIQKGKIVDYQKNWKGRNYDTAVIAAPITIGNEKYFMGVVVIQNKENNRFYVHEVASIKKEGAQPFKTSLAENNSNAGGDTPSIISILQKIVDYNTNAKNNSGYTSKTTVRQLINEAIASLDLTDEDDSIISLVTREANEDVVSAFYRAVNSVSKGTRKKLIDSLADKLLENTVFAERGKYEALDYLKSVMHRLDLSEIQEQLDNSIKRKINARWGFKASGSEDSAIDTRSVITKLNMLGLNISYTDPVQAVYEINNFYDAMREYAEAETGEHLKERLGEDEYKAKKKALAKELERIFEENKTENELAGKLAFVVEKSQEEKKQHREYRKEFKQDENRARAIQNLLYYIRKIKDFKNHKFDSATQPKFNEFMGIAKLIAKMEHIGNINLSSVRELAAEIARWYKKDNPLLDYIDEKHPGVYSEQIAEMLSYFAETEIEETPSTAERSPSLEDGGIELPVPTKQFLSRFGRFSEQQIKSWSNSDRIIVAESESQIVDFVEAALKGEVSGKKLLVGTLPADVVDKIKKATNVDLAGFNFELRADELTHIRKQHGNAEKEAQRGQEAVNVEKITNVIEVVTNFDNVKKGDKENSLVFEKNINGVYHAVTYYAYGNKSIYPHTLYITKNSDLAQTNNVSDKNSHPVRNAQDDLSTATDNSITEKTENVKRERELSYSELRMLGSIVSHLSNVIEKHNKIFRGGQWVDAKDIAVKQYDNMLEAIKNKSAVAYALIRELWYFNDPEAVALYLDGYNSEGFFTTTLNEFREALINQKHAYMKMMERYDAFEKNHKALIKKIKTGKLTEKISVQIGIDEETHQPTAKEQEIPLYAAMDLYMSSQTGENILTFEETGFKLERDGVDTVEEFGTVTREQIEKMYAGWSDEIKELISIIEETYNGQAQEYKYNADLQNRGYSNIILNSKYYPTAREKATRVDDMENLFGTRGVGEESYSFNKNRVKGARNAIYIGNCLTRFQRHIMGISKYAFFTPAFKNFEKIFNVATTDNKNMPKNIKALMSTDKMFFNPLSKSGGSHQSAYDYFNDMIKDMCGINQTGDFGQRLADYLRGAYAGFVLGANPKTILTQLSSYMASFGELDFKSLVKALPKIAINRVSDEVVDKYCPWAAVRKYEIGLTRAMSLREKVGKFSKVFGAGMEWMDRRVVKLLFAACQYQVQKTKKLEIGTEENLIAAGKLLTQVGLRTQQNQLATEKSAAARSKSEIMKGFVAFKGDATKVNSHLTSSIGEIATLNKKIKAARESGDEEALQDLVMLRRRAINKNRKYFTVEIINHAYMALLAMAFAKFYNQDDEDKDENAFWGFIKDMFGSFCGSIPIIADAYAFLNDGYEANSMVYSSINSVYESLGKINNLKNLYADGKEVNLQDWASTLRQVGYSAGQVSGIPFKNINRVIKGVIGWFSDGAEQNIEATFKMPTETEIKNNLTIAFEEDDEGLTEYGLNALYGKYELELIDNVLKREMDRLIKLDVAKDEDDSTNYSPLGFKIPENLEIDGEDVELSAEDRKVFKNGLKSAEKSSADMVKTYYYRQLGDEYKAYAIRKVYEYYDAVSKKAVGASPNPTLMYYGDAVGIDMLAVLLAYKQQLNSASDEEKAKRTKSTKELVTEYLNKFNLTPVQKSLALRALGYSDKERDELVKSHISHRYNLTTEQKEEFLSIAKVD